MTQENISSDKLPPIFVIISGLFFGLFLEMVYLYSKEMSLVSLLNSQTFQFASLGILLYLFTWLTYSIALSRLLKKDLRKVLWADSITYLPSVLLLFYIFQFTPFFDNINRYFANNYAQFSTKFFFLPALLLSLIVLNCIIFLKISSSGYWPEKIERIFASKSRTKFFLFLIISVYVLTFTALSALQYLSFNDNWDLGVYNQAFWNTLQGRFFYTSLQENVHPGIKIASTFALHFSPFYILLLPFYAVAPHVITLLTLQTVGLALAAVPIYMIAKEKLNNFAGLVFAAVYLLFPSVAYINLFDFHEISFAIPLLITSFYFFEKGDFRKFLIFMILSLSVKELVSFSVLMFGIYAIITKRDYKWIIAPFLTSLLWFFGATYVIGPYFGGGYKALIEGIYPEFGGSLLGILHAILTQPVHTLKVLLQAPKIVYVLLLLLPFSFFSLFSWKVLILTIPTFLQNMLAYHRFFYEINFHYTATIIPFIALSAIYGFRTLIYNERVLAAYTVLEKRISLGDIKDIRKNLLYATLVVILLNGIWAQILYSPSPLGFFYQSEKYALSDRTLAGSRVVDLIPPNAPTAAQVYYIPHLSQREELYTLWNDTEKFILKHPEVEYAIVDSVGTFPEILDSFSYFVFNEGWGILYEEEGHVLFKKGSRDKIRLFEIVNDSKIKFDNNFDGIKLLDYAIDKEAVENNDVIRITYYWKSSERVNKNYSIHFYLINKRGEVELKREQIPTHKLYQTSEWRPGEIIKDTHSILIPTLKPGVYTIAIRLGNDEKNLISLGSISILDKVYVN